jgi:hypothetical protein
MSTSLEAIVRRRGRPKGSKNRQRSDADEPTLFDAYGPLPLVPVSTPPIEVLRPQSAAKSLKFPGYFLRNAPPVPTKVFCTYWWFAQERQSIFFGKIRDPRAGTWTCDATLRAHKFTNTYRASDRVSQYLIANVIGSGSVEDVFFRTMLFKIFNKIGTWEILRRKLGQISWRSYDFENYDAVLSEAIESGTAIYSAAYIMPSPAFGHPRKHSNHLRLIEKMMNERLPERLHTRATDMAHAFATIRSYPGIGDFLAYQYTIDLNYGPVLVASENDFVMAGPGALDGIRKCFSDIGDLSAADVIRWTCDMQEKAFDALGLGFKSLWGRELHLIDCQNLFCETDKYARVHHPEAKGRTERTRIKQFYRPQQTQIEYAYPEKWGINTCIASDPGFERDGTAI